MDEQRDTMETEESPCEQVREEMYGQVRDELREDVHEGFRDELHENVHEQVREEHAEETNPHNLFSRLANFFSSKPKHSASEAEIEGASRKKTESESRANTSKKVLAIVLAVVLSILVFAGILFAFAAAWYIRVYGDQSFASILFTLTNNTAGTSKAILTSFALSALLPAVAVTAVVLLFIWYRGKTHLVMRRENTGREFKLYPFRRFASICAAFVIFAGGMLITANTVHFFEYVESQSSYSSIYDEEYINPADVTVSFPEEKRNLVYIWVESLETSFLSTGEGGFLAENAIPELYWLASDYDNFSQSEDVGGFRNTASTGWTVAAMVAQSTGLQLKLPATISSNNTPWSSDYLTQATSITDILHQNGYKQALMVGSDAEFGSRGSYFTQHGVDKVYDLYTAYEDGIVPNGYYEWWGFEDKYLYQYAQKEITQLSQEDDPFAFFMLTADTHFPDGYTCSLCKNEHEEQYENVYSCTSEQVYQFITWLQQQPYWDNTTVVICGDHITMDNEYVTRVFPSGSNYTNRYVYNCIINSAYDEEADVAFNEALQTETGKENTANGDDSRTAGATSSVEDSPSATATSSVDDSPSATATSSVNDSRTAGTTSITNENTSTLDESTSNSTSNSTSDESTLNESATDNSSDSTLESTSNNALDENASDSTSDESDEEQGSRFTNRDITSFDMFPTTLASLGCLIQGNRLGLGTNLYSSLQTISERLGFETVQAETEKSSHYFENHFWK